ncbi:MAG: condensation domain-containing protein [Chloroflexi bacterium]|nr:condensation domain-containing protein [Chloroflexota bacterium]
MATLLDKTQAKETLAPIPLVDRNQPLPVSFAQQRLLIIDQLEPNQATYNIPLVFQINGRLDTAAFQQAVDTLYVRHETLRTGFVYTDDDQPIQQLANETHLPITSVDFTHLPADQRELEIRKWVQAEIQRPFTLSQAPLSASPTSR